MASKVVGRQHLQLCQLYSVAVRKEATGIVSDPLHPLNCHFERLPSGRRLKVALARKNVFKRSFVPSSVAVLNSM